MKILVHNYSSEISTEALYITQALKNLGFDAHLWSNEVSAFDAFDSFEPDIYITHAAFINNDIIKRLAGTDIKVLINTTGMNEGVLPELSRLVPNCTVFQNDSKLNGVNSILPSADIFLPVRLNPPKYKINLMCLVENRDDVDKIEKMDKSKYHTYHVIGITSDLNDLESVDAVVTLRDLPTIYSNYDERITCNASQLTFDAAFHGGSCGILSNPKTISMILKKESVQDIATPYNRVASLFRMIGQDKIVQAAEAMVKGVK